MKSYNGNPIAHFQIRLQMVHNKSEKFENITPMPVDAENLPILLARLDDMFNTSNSNVWEIRVNEFGSIQGHYIPIAKADLKNYLT